MFRERKHDMKSANPSVEIQKERFYPEIFDNQVSATAIQGEMKKASF
jgi:hypothetical protein